MNATTSTRLLLVAAITAPLIAFWSTDPQDPGQQDWVAHVKKACTSRRYGIHLAAARKVAAGGDLAVAAIAAYSADNGRNALPASLVDAVADSGKAGPKVSRLLWDWTMDPDFFWRSSAMRGLALRAPTYRRAAADGGEAGLDPSHREPSDAQLSRVEVAGRIRWVRSGTRTSIRRYPQVLSPPRTSSKASKRSGARVWQPTEEGRARRPR